MLPGLMMPPGLIGGGADQKIVLKASSTNNNASGDLVAPAGISAGDLIVVVNNRFGPNAAPLISGFTSAAYATGNTGSADRYVRIQYKLAAGNEGSATLIANAAGGAGFGICFVFGTSTGAAFASAGHGTGWSAVSTSGNPAAVTIPAAPTGLAIAIGAHFSSGSLTGLSASPAWEDATTISNTVRNLRAGYKTFVGPTQEVVFDQGASGTANMNVGNYITLALA